MVVEYVSVDEVYAIHKQVVKIGGGIHTLRDPSLLYEAVERPKATFASRDLYPQLEQKAAALIHSLIKGHPFVDGNKRTAYFSMLRFMQKNNRNVKASKQDILTLCVSVANGSMDLGGLTRWIEKRSRKISP